MSLSDLTAIGCAFVFFILTGMNSEWVAARFDRALDAMGRGQAHRIEQREKEREAELELKRRELDGTHPEPVKPVCGCGHDLAFHNVENNACRQQVDGKACLCQRYTGPELVGQIYLPPLISPEVRDGDAR